MKTHLLRHIATALAILVALAPAAPLEAAKHQRQRKSTGHISAAKIDAIIARFTHDELAAFPKGSQFVVCKSGNYRIYFCCGNVTCAFALPLMFRRFQWCGWR